MRTPRRRDLSSARYTARPMTDIGRIVVPAEVPEGYALFYTTTDFEGHLRGDGAAQVLLAIQQRFGVDATLATCVQVHGATVVRAPAEAGWRECDSCDALWSDQPGLALAIKVADCLPVTLIDDAHGVIANIHSGWRGAVQRITGATLDTLVRDSPFDPATARAWLGPTIRVCCFEVGDEVVEQFRAAYLNADAFIDRSLGPKPHIDVAGLTSELLRALGITRIVDVAMCTRCGAGTEAGSDRAHGQPLFHSYRRDPKRGGRNLAIVARQGIAS
jgi:YfiH family protein